MHRKRRGRHRRTPLPARLLPGAAVDLALIAGGGL